RAFDQPLAALSDLVAFGIDGLDADRAELVAADRAAAPGEEQLVGRALLDRGTEVAADLRATGEHEAALGPEAVVGPRLERAAQRGVAVFELIGGPQIGREPVSARLVERIVAAVVGRTSDAGHRGEVADAEVV